ncbi:SigE family RNA polymerase sigma factor [Dactylosporangium salmoneum]|uniref:SigE family RNA polymerase sigma factor n=1 Tax=Dactylosporangium salmoneum TaxID=53361 RepID=A0ABN3H6M4_9ACTN
MLGSVDRSPPESFESFYRSRFHALTLQIYAFTGDLGDAQDLVQEAFCRAYARWNAVQHYEDPVAWVRRVAWNLATSRWRRLRTAASFLQSHRVQHVAAPSADRVDLTWALKQLPGAQRRIFVLFHIADLSLQEIAEQEQVALGTVKSTLSRARAAVARMLSEQQEGSSRV